MEQQIRFCTTSDGVRIAYATVGEGPPLVSVSGWVGHLGLDWNHADGRAFYEGLATGRLLVRYDKRGTGLSDWDAQDFSMEARLRDLGAVVDTLGLERFAMLGVSEGGPTALVYASRNPERITRLVLYGSFHRWPQPPEVTEPVLALIRAHWGMASAAVSAFFIPSADPAFVAWFTERERVSASAETAARILEVNMGLDLTPLLKGIRAPTLVIHRRGDTVVPFEIGREMAALIPGARFEPLEGEHPEWMGDSKAILDAIDAFLAEEGGQAAQVAPSGLVTILFTDMEGSTALTQQLGDDRAQDIVRQHNTVVREALKAHAGKEIKHTGDGIMASFASARGAVDCAIAIQRTLAVGDSVRVRIGLNAGEPVAEEHDLFGTAVQLAARICARAEPGQILAANVVRELAAGKGFLFADGGDVALRGFEDPVRLYQVRWEREREGQA